MQDLGKKRAGFYTCSGSGTLLRVWPTLLIVGAKVLLFFDIRKFLRQKNRLHLSNYVGQKTSQVLKLGRPGNCKCLFGIIVGRLYRMV